MADAAMVEGVDLSNWNADLPDLSPFGFVFHKATQGNWFTDKYYSHRHRIIRDAGKVWGAYLFPEPSSTVRSQLEWFRDTADIQAGDIVALDFEDFYSNGGSEWNRYGYRTIAHMGGDLMIGLREMYPKNRVLLYCNLSTYQLVVHPYSIPAMDGLWIAAPDRIPDMDWVFWQYKTAPVDTNRSMFDTVKSLHQWAEMSDMPSADDIVEALMRRQIKVRVGHIAEEGEEQSYWTTSVENLLGSVWGQVFNATGEYGPSLAGGLESVIDDIGVVHSAILALGDSPELTRLFERLVTALERMVGER